MNVIGKQKYNPKSHVTEGDRCEIDKDPLKNGNIAANFPQYCNAFAVIMEKLLPLTMKMFVDGKIFEISKIFENEELATLLVCFG
jgi:hypothetical protein